MLQTSMQCLPDIARKDGEEAFKANIDVYLHASI